MYSTIISLTSTERSCCSNEEDMRLEKWFISNLNDSQRKIIDQSIDEDIIVQRAAGKTNLAIHVVNLYAIGVIYVRVSNLFVVEK